MSLSNLAARFAEAEASTEGASGGTAEAAPGNGVTPLESDSDASPAPDWQV